MSNYINGFIYGRLIGESHLLGSFHSAGFMGDLKNVSLSNENSVDCNIDGDNIFGKLEGKYNNGITSGDIGAEIVGKIKSYENTTATEILNIINSYLSSIGLDIKFIEEYGKFVYVEGSGIRRIVCSTREPFAVHPNDKVIIKVVKDCTNYVFTIMTENDRVVWNIPHENIIKISVLCELFNLSVVPVDNPPDPYNFYYFLEMLRLEEQKRYRYKSKSLPTNNLFTPYTTFTPPANKYFNNAYGEKIGLVNNINPNETTAETYYHVFENSNNNTTHGQQNGNTVIMENKQTKIYDKIYNYEKYHQYKLKVNIDGMSEPEKERFIKNYMETYKMDILRENGIIYGIYIV